MPSIRDKQTFSLAQNTNGQKPKDRIKVLYIGGQGRSGSTLVGRLLGEIDGVYHGGELSSVWLRGLTDNRLCGCSRPFRECEFWNAVFERGFGGFDNIDLEKIFTTKRDMERLRTVPNLLFPFKSAKQMRQLAEYTKVLGTLYKAISDISGARVIVDGSKIMPYSYILSQVPEIDLRLLHLVRDSRAVAYSNQRKKPNPAIHWKKAEFNRISPMHVAILWNLTNTLMPIQNLGNHYMFARYEDIVRDPMAAFTRLWALLDEPKPSLEFLNLMPMHLSPGHTVAGNPDRFNPEVNLRLDTEWQENMNAKQRRLVTTLTYPLLRQYGYLTGK